MSNEFPVIPVSKLSFLDTQIGGCSLLHKIWFTNRATNPIENQHKQKVGWPSIKLTGLQIFRVIVQEITHQHPVEARLWGDRVVEQCAERTP